MCLAIVCGGILFVVQFIKRLRDRDHIDKVELCMVVGEDWCCIQGLNFRAQASTGRWLSL